MRLVGLANCAFDVGWKMPLMNATTTATTTTTTTATTTSV